MRLCQKNLRLEPGRRSPRWRPTPVFPWKEPEELKQRTIDWYAIASRRTSRCAIVKKPVTHFHRRHVSDLKSRPAEQRLSSERLETIRATLGAVIMAAGLSQFG